MDDGRTVIKIIDVSLLQGDMALHLCNDGIIECSCDEFHICQECFEEYKDPEWERNYEKEGHKTGNES